MAAVDEVSKQPTSDQTIDPDFFEVLVQSLAAIASIATLANEWLKYRDRKEDRIFKAERLSLKRVIEQLRETFGDLFLRVDDILSIFAKAETRSLKPLRAQPLGWGYCTYDFTRDEFSYLSSKLESIDNHFATIRSGCHVVQTILANSRLAGEDAITENLEDVKSRLNEILFRSDDIGQALKKLDLLKERATRFLDQINNLGN